MARSDPARYARGLDVLTRRWAGLSPAEQQMVLSQHRRFGPQAVREGLRLAGWPADALYAFDEALSRGGPNAIAEAVGAQLAANVQADTELATIKALSGFSDEQWRAAAQILATEGPEALAREVRALGLPRHVAGMAAHTVATMGAEQARKAVQAHAASQARADALHAATERDVRTAKPRDPLGSEAIAQASLDFATRHGAALEKVGLGLREGESAVGWLKRIAKVDGAPAKIAEALGSAPGSMRDAHTIVEKIEMFDRAGELRAEIQASTQKVQQFRARGAKSRDPADKTPMPTRRDGLDDATKRAFREHGEDPARTQLAEDRRYLERSSDPFDRAMAKAHGIVEGYEAPEPAETSRGVDAAIRAAEPQV